MARALRAALTARAQFTIGPTATADDYLMHWVGLGFAVQDLTRVLATDIGHPGLHVHTVDTIISRACRAELQRIRTARLEQHRAAADRQAAADRPATLVPPANAPWIARAQEAPAPTALTGDSLRRRTVLQPASPVVAATS